jgi:hypothetical protein
MGKIPLRHHRGVATQRRDTESPDEVRGAGRGRRTGAPYIRRSGVPRQTSTALASSPRGQQAHGRRKTVRLVGQRCALEL